SVMRGPGRCSDPLECPNDLVVMCDAMQPVTAESQDHQSPAPDSRTGGGTNRVKSEVRNFAEQQKAAGADQIADFAQAADATANGEMKKPGRPGFQHTCCRLAVWKRRVSRLSGPHTGRPSFSRCCSRIQTCTSCRSFIAIRCAYPGVLRTTRTPK